MPRGTPSPWTYDRLQVQYDPRALSHVRLPGTRVGLRVPTEVRIAGIVVVEDAHSTPRAVGVDVDLRLDTGDARYYVHEEHLTHVTPGDLEDHLADLARQGVEPTFDIDNEIRIGIRWEEIRRRAVEDVEVIVLVRDESGDERETTLQDPDLTDLDVVGLLWLRARLMGPTGEPNTLIASWFGVSQQAAAQRLLRARKAGIVPPTRQGQRKVRP